MIRLLGRFHSAGYELSLTPPGQVSAEVLASFVIFREGVFRQFSSLPPPASAVDQPGESDLDAWHLLVHRGRDVVGCIRFLTFNPTEAETVPSRVLANSACQFSEVDRERCLEALRNYVAVWREYGGPLTQVGGLAVASHTQGTPVGPILCLAGNAFMRLIESKAGVVFAAEKTGGAGLYEKAGCFPIASRGEPLGMLTDHFHQDRVLLMGIAPLANVSTLEPVVEHLKTELFLQLSKETNDLHSHRQYDFDGGNAFSSVSTSPV